METMSVPSRTLWLTLEVTNGDLIVRSLRQRNKAMNLNIFGFQARSEETFGLRNELRRQGCSVLNKPACIGFFRLILTY